MHRTRYSAVCLFQFYILEMNERSLAIILYKDQMLVKDQRIILKHPIETVLANESTDRMSQPTINRCLQENTDQGEQTNDQSTDLSSYTIQHQACSDTFSVSYSIDLSL